MLKFPKTLYVTVQEEWAEDASDIEDLSHEDALLYSTQSNAVEDTGEGDLVAVYQLVKHGVVKTQRKVVFE
jgi:hypothetical protein